MRDTSHGLIKGGDGALLVLSHRARERRLIDVDLEGCVGADVLFDHRLCAQRPPNVVLDLAVLEDVPVKVERLVGKLFLEELAEQHAQLRVVQDLDQRRPVGVERLLCL